MRIIVSPAKKMNIERDGFLPPLFLARAKTLREALKAMPEAKLRNLFFCSDSLLRLEAERLRTLTPEHSHTPAILSYEGLQYRSMAPSVMHASLRFPQAHLRIVSAFYGLLRPFENVIPHRLEMRAKLAVDGHPNLYAFWGGALAKALADEGGVVLNLAAKEYADAVLPHLPPWTPVVSCRFSSERRVLSPNGAPIAKLLAAIWFAFWRT